MKNYKLYIIITGLLVAIAIGGTYVVMSNYGHEDVKNNEIKDNNTNQDGEKKEEVPKLEDGVKLVETVKNGNEIVQKYEVIINDKVNDVSLRFKYEDEFVRGTYKDTVFVSEEIYDKDFNSSYLNNSFNEKNFQFIKGRDGKSYLAVVAPSTYSNLLYVFNDKMELLTKDLIDSYYVTSSGMFDGFVISAFDNFVLEVENGEPWYSNMFENVNINSIRHINVKLENNKIYFLASVLNEAIDSKYKGVLEERVYEINNDKLEYRVIKEYKILELAQQV